LEAIIRKFTNYRNSRKDNVKIERDAERSALKAAAASLVDLSSFSKGRECFKRRNHQEICDRRSKILSRDPEASAVGAYQTSLKELWAKADHDHWEEEALKEAGDIHL
jgi:hypothetical protein